MSIPYWLTPEWVDAIGSLLSGLAVVGGLIFAGKQLSSWKSEALNTRRADIAGELMTSVYRVSRALRSLRTPFDVAPPEGQEANKIYALEIRYKRFDEYGEIFKDLELRQMQAKALFDDKELDDAVEVFFSIRAKVVSAIQMLATKTNWYDPEYPDNKKLLRDLQSRMWGSYCELDPLGAEQMEAVGRIEKILFPRIRMESTK